MLAFGTVAGGAGASLTGGNFWEGAATGLAVSGLNHLAHYVESHKFDKEINKLYGDKADKAIFGPSQNDVDDAIENLPTLKKIYVKLKSKFSNLAVHYNDNFSKDLGVTIFDNENKTVSNIYIYKTAGESYKIFAQTILHEFGHAMSAYHGFFFKNKTKYGKYSEIPTAIDEIYAHKFAFHHGGVSYNTKYYSEFVYFLSKTSYKINAESLLLPSF